MYLLQDLLAALSAADVDCVVCSVVACIMHGVSRTTQVVDLCDVEDIEGLILQRDAGA